MEVKLVFVLNEAEIYQVWQTPDGSGQVLLLTSKYLHCSYCLPHRFMEIFRSQYDCRSLDFLQLLIRRSNRSSRGRSCRFSAHVTMWWLGSTLCINVRTKFEPWSARHKVPCYQSQAFGFAVPSRRRPIGCLVHTDRGWSRVILYGNM